MPVIGYQYGFLLLLLTENPSRAPLPISARLAAFIGPTGKTTRLVLKRKTERGERTKERKCQESSENIGKKTYEIIAGAISTRKTHLPVFSPALGCKYLHPAFAYPLCARACSTSASSASSASSTG
jgi:hypothetical protein